MQRGFSRNIVLVFCLLAILAITLWEGMRLGVDERLPGPISRNRDAIAVALSLVVYGDWLGYASYRDVNLVLNNHGLTLHEDELKALGYKSYIEVLESKKAIEGALAAASNIPNLSRTDLYAELEGEKGLSLFYALSFKLFGVALSSFFYTYMVLLTISVVAFGIAFFRRKELLLFGAVVLYVHCVLVQIVHTVAGETHEIHSARFMAALSALAMFHIMFALALRERATVKTVALVVIQTIILVFIVLCRSSAAWELIAILSVWLGLIVLSWRKAKRTILGPSAVNINQGHGLIGALRESTFWPVAVLGVGIFAIWLNQFAYNDLFVQQNGTRTRIFWHNFATALHNNPDRTRIFGIPRDIDPNDDQTTYFLFEKELERRREPLSTYLIGDANWRLRVPGISRDFRWSLYEEVVREVSLRSIVRHPVYAMKSLMFYQPRQLIGVTGRTYLLRSEHFKTLSIVFLVLAFLAAWRITPAVQGVSVLAASTALLCSTLPALVAAVMDQRASDVGFMLDVVIIAGLFLLASKAHFWLKEQRSPRKN